MLLVEVRTGDINERAGIVITDKINVLGCLPTPSTKYPNFDRLYDLPKGHMQKGETPIQGAIRECYEETNVLFKEETLESAGTFTVYNAPLHLFIATVKMPPLEKLSCPSTFMNNYAKMPENCGYAYVPIKNIQNKFFPELAEILLKIFDSV